MFTACGVDRYPNKMACRISYSCAKLAAAKGGCNKRFSQILPTWCWRKLSVGDRRQFVKNYCKRSCKNCVGKCSTFTPVLFCICVNICTSYPLTISLFVSFTILVRTIRQRTFEDMRNNQDIGGTCAVRSNQRCNPKTWDKYQGYIDGCCTSEQRCGAGEGDCTDDSDCMPGLVCGKNNCPKDQGFGNRADCCEPFSDEFKPGKYVPAIFLDKLIK